jgi:hypothetical protein
MPPLFARAAKFSAWRFGEGQDSDVRSDEVETALLKVSKPVVPPAKAAVGEQIG